MNVEQLNAIKERAAKATPGQWLVRKHTNGTIDVISVETTEHHEYLSRIELGELEDAEFIAHARENVPALVAEVERLQQETEYLKRSLLYIADRRESNRDWSTAHNALAVYGRPKGAY